MAEDCSITQGMIQQTMCVCLLVIILSSLFAAEELVGAFGINGIPVTKRQMRGFLSAMDPTGSNHIDFVPFARAMYAFSVRHREVSSPDAYAIFPDSDFSAETATGCFKFRRNVWTVSIATPSSACMNVCMCV